MPPLVLDLILRLQQRDYHDSTNTPTEEHIKYAKYVLKYLKGTKELKIKYDGSSDAGLIGYSDSDWGENRDDCHSTSGHVFLMANGAISWTSQ